MNLEHLCICNLGSDDLTYIDTSFSHNTGRVSLLKGEERIGPRGICCSNNKIYTANEYGKGISEVDPISGGVENYNLGVSCTDIAAFEGKLYVLCGDANNIIVFDTNSACIESLIPCGNLPHSMCINKQKREILISNMLDDSITIINLDKYDEKINIKVGSYPMSLCYSMDNEYILICESNIGMDFNGALCIMSTHNKRIINRVSLGKTPMDMYYDGELCYISNYADGTISVVNGYTWKNKRQIIVGGMPRGITADAQYICVCDSYNDSLIIMDRIGEIKKIISTGREPMKIIKTYTNG